MAYFDPAKETSILVDASPFGLGAIQVQDNKAICYASRALTDVEKRYSQTDREMLSAFYGVENFHLYVQGAPFKLITDHKPLLGIVKSQNPRTARIERWRLRLMPYDIKFVYRPGRNEQNPPDYISRHPQTTPTRKYAGEEYIALLAKGVGEIPDCHDSPRHATTAVGHSHTLMDVQLRESSVGRV